MTLASYISSLRIILIIPIIFLTSFQISAYNYLSLFLFIIAGLTDYIDGYIARKTNTETSLGALLDLLADKLLVCVLLIWFISLNDSLFYSIPTIVIITRELTISSMRQFLLEKKELKDLKVSYIARSKTTMQIICISLIIISPEFGDLFYSFALFLLCVTAMLSLFSFYDYMAKWFKDIF
jgi:CDP-diacylglycerol--glycerol-3-phosphate 3-phosphatidyltransferase